MTSTTFMLLAAGVVGPWLVAFLRKHNWSDELVVVVAAVVSLVCFLFGQFADGVLMWPPSQDFWLGLAAAFGLNQAGYRVAKRAVPAAMAKVESL